jgi:hypothetical protein
MTTSLPNERLEANEGNKKAFISRQDENEGIQRIPARTREPDRPHPSL